MLQNYEIKLLNLQQNDNSVNLKNSFILFFHCALLPFLVACQQQIQEKTAPLLAQDEEALAKKIGYMNDVIEDYPNIADYYFRRAVLNLEARKENLAQKDINQALLLDSARAEFYFIKAKIHEIRGEYKESLAAAQSAERRGFREIDADMLIGKMSYHVNDYHKAGLYLDRVRKVLPDLAEMCYYRGLTYFQTRDTANSVVHLNKAIELKKDYGEAYRALIDLYNNYGAYKTAIGYTRKAIKNCGQAGSKKDEAAFYFSYGRSLWALQSYDSAIVLYSQAFELDSTIWQAGYQVAMYCINKKNYEKAEKYLTKVLVQKTDIENGHYLLAAIYEYHLKRMIDALKHYQRAANLDRQSPQIQMDIRRVVKKIEYEEYRKSPQYTLDILQKEKGIQLQQRIQKKDSL